MRNRGDRLYRKREIKRRLRADIERKLFKWGWTDGEGNVLDSGRRWLDDEAYVARWRKRAVRNEGKRNQHQYRCGSRGTCDYCIDNLFHSTRQRDLAMEADRRAYEDGEYEFGV